MQNIMNRVSIYDENKKKRASFFVERCSGGYESSMKADEGVPSGVSGWCVGCYGEVKATTLTITITYTSTQSE